MSRFSGRDALHALGRRLRHGRAAPSASPDAEPTPLMGAPSPPRPPIAGPAEPPPHAPPAEQPPPSVPDSLHGPRKPPRRWHLRRPSLGFLHDGRPHLPRRRRRAAGERRPDRLGDAPAALGRAIAATRAAPAAAGPALARIGHWLVAPLRGVWRAWLGLNVYVRRRIAVVAAAVAVVVAFVVLAVPALPCQYPGGDVCAPQDDAAKLVPADSLAYVHVNVDPSDHQYQLAAADLTRVPLLSNQILGRLLAGLPGSAGSPLGFGRVVRPWLGSEAAVALLPSRGPPQEVELLAVADNGGAARYQRAFAGPGALTVTYRGTRIVVGRGGVASAILHGFLVVGTPSGARAVIATATGAEGTSPLSASSAARDVQDMLPPDAVAEAYLSPAGARAITGRPNAVLSFLAPFVAPRATRGVAVGLTAGDGSLELEIRSALDPKRARARPGFFEAFPPFEPTLADQLPPSTLAYLGIGEPGRAIESLLEQASTEEPGLARAIGAVLQQLRAAAHLAVRRDLLPALGSEGALALETAPSAGGAAPARPRKPSQVTPIPGLGGSASAPAPAGAPYLLYLGGGIDPAKARPALARLEVPLAAALGGAPGAGFTHTTIAGVPAQSLSSSRALDLTYAFVDGRLVVATGPAGIAALARGPRGLASTEAYRAATAGFPASSSFLAYLDLRGLIALGEQAGLAQSPAFQTFAADIHRLAALGVSVTASPDSLATDARLILGSGGGAGSGD